MVHKIGRKLHKALFTLTPKGSGKIKIKLARDSLLGIVIENQTTHQIPIQYRVDNHNQS